MKTFTAVALVTLAAVSFTNRNYAQGTVTNAPLYLFINGSGSVSPLQNGQLLQVGQSYQMEAVPDSGFAFSNWQEINVFVEASTYINSDGVLVTNPPETLVSPTPVYVETPSLTFTMPPVDVLVDTNGTLATVTMGWQANFDAIPEPTGIGLILFGSATSMFSRRWSWKRPVRDKNLLRGSSLRPCQ